MIAPPHGSPGACRSEERGQHERPWTVPQWRRQQQQPIEYEVRWRAEKKPRARRHQEKFLSGVTLIVGIEDPRYHSTGRLVLLTGALGLDSAVASEIHGQNMP